MSTMKPPSLPTESVQTCPDASAIEPLALSSDAQLSLALANADVAPRDPSLGDREQADNSIATIAESTRGRRFRMLVRDSKSHTAVLLRTRVRNPSVRETSWGLRSEIRVLDHTVPSTAGSFLRQLENAQGRLQRQGRQGRDHRRHHRRPRQDGVVRRRRNRITLPGATKDTLNAPPELQYAR
jgi:hypothetical protein